MAEFYQGRVDAANSGNKEAIQESTSRETYESHVAISFIDYGMSQGHISTNDYLNYVNFAESLYNWKQPEEYYLK